MESNIISELIKNLYNLKMIEGGLVTDHPKEFNIITSHIGSFKVVLDDEIKPSYICVPCQQIGIQQEKYVLHYDSQSVIH